MTLSAYSRRVLEDAARHGVPRRYSSLVEAHLRTAMTVPHVEVVVADLDRHGLVDSNTLTPRGRRELAR